MEIKKLSNPPIKEAILEIRFNPNKNITVSRLKEFADSLSKVYIKVEPLENRSFQLTLSRQQEPQHVVNIQPSGYKLTNAENNRVVIAAIDRFVISFLAPYTQWSDLRDTAKSIYSQYLQFAPQAEIIRLGMRYINTIKLPLKDEFQFEKYINTFPSLPKHKELPDSLSRFETVIVMPHEDIGCSSTIRQTLLDVDPSDSEYLPLILDIDVYRNKAIESVQTDEIWASFEKMRTKKNAIFFGTLTDRAIEQYD